MFIDVVRGAAAGTVVAHALSRVLRFVGKILYEIMLEGFLCLTKPSILAIHGSISPCPGFHAGAFLCFMCIILQSLSSFAIRFRGIVCAPWYPRLANRVLQIRVNTDCMRKYEML